MKAGFESVVTSFGYLVQRIVAEEDKALFDGTLLSDLAKNGPKIVTCAGLLFAGYSTRPHSSPNPMVVAVEAPTNPHGDATPKTTTASGH